MKPRNRNKIRLNRKKQQRTGAVITRLRELLDERRNQIVKCVEEKCVLQWRVNDLTQRLAERETRTYEQRVLPKNPPAPFKYWYEVFIMSKETIMRSGFNSRLIVPVELDDINTTSETMGHAVDVSLQDILFGTLRELNDFVLPRKLVRKVEEEIHNAVFEGRVQKKGDGVISYDGLPVNLKLMHLFGQLKERYRR